MTSFFGSTFWLLVTLGVLVTFHEFGHYWVAKRCGVRVLRFSVGFGKALWKRTGRDGCEYQVAAIPLGGYVKMLDKREGDVDPALASQEFTAQSVWKRIAIVAAGPGFNLIFTVAAFWLMFLIGRPDVAPVVSATPQSMAARAGVQSGDRILSVGDRQVASWTDAMDAVVTATLGREPLPVTVRDSHGELRTLTLPLQQLPADQPVENYLDTIGLRPAPVPAVIGEVLPDTPAAVAGLQAGDLVLAINGHAIANYQALQKQVPELAAESARLELSIRRDGKPLDLVITARQEALDGQPSRWVIGVLPKPAETALLRYGPVKALGASLHATWNGVTQTFSLIGHMLSGDASTRNLSGVIGIAQVANASAQMGLAWFLNFLALVSLSLAILNLLPIPVLDGGHLLYYLVELVKGSPVSEQAMVVGQYIGLALLFTLMGLAFYNDIHRIWLS